MSRIIVKGIPKEITDIELRDHFNKKGEVTDVKIMRKENGESRKFAFIGFKTEEQCKDSIKYFNNTYINTCKVSIEPAKVQGDASLKTAWSKKTKGSEIKSKVNNKPVLDSDKQKKIDQLLSLANLTSNKNKFNFAAEKLAEKQLKNQQTEMLTESNNRNDENSNDNQLTVDKMLNPDNLDPKRLYVRNLAFEVKDEDLKNLFSRFGEITEIHIPKNYNNMSFGYGYVGFATIESAVMALSDLDKTYFQGRIMHILTAKMKEEKVKLDNFKANKNLTFKQQKQEILKDDYKNETNWNYLFMNQNAVIESIAKKLNIPKSEIMSKDNADLAVQVAAMETSVINQTKEWLNEQGINIDALKGKKGKFNRSKNIILIKNISPNLNAEKLEGYFSRYGMLVRFLLSPSNTLGIAEFVDNKHAENCLAKLSYFEIDKLPLYLEYAPEGLIQSKDNTNKNQNTITKNKDEQSINLVEGEGKILFVNNLNFITRDKALDDLFKKHGFIGSKVKVTLYKKGENELSRGYGFIEFDDEIQANKALRQMQGVLLDGHSLQLNLAKTSENKGDNKLLSNKRKPDNELNDYEYEGEDVNPTKLTIKNLAFETDEKELRQLFKHYGELKSVRLPVKIDGSHRGFAFIDFVSHEEAKKAFRELQNTHFYGRKLVLEWAQKDKTVEELRTETERKAKIANVQTHRTQKKAELDIRKNKVKF